MENLKVQDNSWTIRKVRIQNVGEIHAKYFKFAFILHFALLEKYIYIVDAFLFSISPSSRILDVFNLMFVLNERVLYIQLYFCVVQKNKTLHKVKLIKASYINLIKRILYLWWLLEYYLSATQVQRMKKCKAGFCEEYILCKDHEKKMRV